jgi:hypothetical protein
MKYKVFKSHKATAAKAWQQSACCAFVFAYLQSKFFNSPGVLLFLVFRFYRVAQLKCDYAF